MPVPAAPYRPLSRPSRWLPWCLCALLAASLAGLTQLAMTVYRRAAEVRLTPDNVKRYSRENAGLPAARSGRIVFFGDSRIEGWDPLPDLPGAEPVDRGIGGDTTGQARLRFEHDVLALQPSAVLIQVGINDLAAGELLGRNAEAIEIAVTNLDAMIAAARERGIRVLLLTVVRPSRIPLWRRPLMDDDIYADVDRLNAQLRTRAGDGVVVLDADALLSNGERRLPASYAADTLHFTPAAYTRLNALISDNWVGPGHAVQ